MKRKQPNQKNTVTKLNGKRESKANIVQTAFLNAATSALARRKQFSSHVTRRTFGLRWRFTK